MAIRKGTKGKDELFASNVAEAFDGVQGYDVVNYSRSIAGVTIDLVNRSANGGDAAGDTFANIDAFKLSTSNDVFLGGSGRDIANGDNGDDSLSGRGGNDALTGHSGNDTIFGGDGNDSIWGGGNNDSLYGNGGNDRIQGDSHADVISGGTDNGSFTMNAVTQQFYKYSNDILIPLHLIDDPGEWVSVPMRGAIDNASNVTSLNRANGDAIYVLTNGYDDSRDWNAIRGNGSVLDLGPGGRIDADSSIVFNAGPGPSNSSVRFNGTSAGAPSPKVAGNNPDGIVTKTTGYSVSGLQAGDTLWGGEGADVFVFNPGDGVDRINDFLAGVDYIDVVAAWFDGIDSNGEFTVRAYGSGSLVLFTDNSVDGVVNNTAIHLVGVQTSAVDASLFI